MGFLSLPTFAYYGQGDLQARTKIDYDNSRLAAVYYDGPAVYVWNQSCNLAVCDRALFAKFTKFLAADATAADSQYFISSGVRRSLS